MVHQIFDPTSDLRPFVQCYWSLEGPRIATPTNNTIVPDGSMKLIFHYGDPYTHFPKQGGPVALPRCFLIGQLTRPFEVGPTGKTGTFFVRFHPDGFLPFAPAPIRTMENAAIPLEVLFGDEGKDLEQQIMNARATPERITVIEAFLLNRLTDAKADNFLVKASVETILKAKGHPSIDEISNLMNINRRQLERKFSAMIGLSPKQLSKIARLQATLKLLRAKKTGSLTTLAYEGNYYDQAHFIRDFREFTGITPKEFFGGTLDMSLIFEGEE